MSSLPSSVGTSARWPSTVWRARPSTCCSRSTPTARSRTRSSPKCSAPSSLRSKTRRRHRADSHSRRFLLRALSAAPRCSRSCASVSARSSRRARCGSTSTTWRSARTSTLLRRRIARR
eukprot:Amastigsp_a512473_4.p5 type:complete len:119 gc:universal Amastigsp_a512473_4:587-943(+)